MAQDPKKEDSVYDFFYVDLRRIAQFSSQFSQYGHLTNLTRSVNETRTGGGSVGVSQTSVNKSTAEQIGQVRQFDPQWLNPLTFLDEANQRGLINRAIDGTGIGKFVLATGQLLIFDVEMLRDAWDKPSIKKQIRNGVLPSQDPISGNRAQRRSIKADKKPVPDEFESFMDLLQIMPHAVQCRLLGDNANLWSTLEEQYIGGKSSDLILKHGSLVAGDWNMLGILDAYPYVANYVNEDGQNEADIAADVAGTAVGQVAARIGVVARNFIGRPEGAYGVTPLLIFREVSG